MNSIPTMIGMDVFAAFINANDTKKIGNPSKQSFSDTLTSTEEGHVNDAGNPIITLFDNNGKLYTQYVDQVIDGFLSCLKDLPGQLELQEVAYNSSEIEIKVLNKRHFEPETEPETDVI